MGGTGRTAAVAAAMVVLPAFATQPDPTLEPIEEADSTLEPVDDVDPSLEALALTRDGQDAYDLTVDDGSVTVTADPDNVGGNTRVMFRPTAALPTVNQMSCATWDDPQGDIRQPGAALRVVHEGESFRAVMISKNVWEQIFWNFNIHLVDTSQEPPLRPYGGVELDQTFVPRGSLITGPWRMCARVVGLELAVKVWPLSHPEPEWGDKSYGTVVELPDGWDYAGDAGWYIGHLMPGESTSFSGLSTTGLSLYARMRSLQYEIAAAAVALP